MWRWKERHICSPAQEKVSYVHSLPLSAGLSLFNLLLGNGLPVPLLFPQAEEKEWWWGVVATAMRSIRKALGGRKAPVRDDPSNWSLGRQQFVADLRLKYTVSFTQVVRVCRSKNKSYGIIKANRIHSDIHWIYKQRPFALVGHRLWVMTVLGWTGCQLCRPHLICHPVWCLWENVLELRKNLFTSWNYVLDCFQSSRHLLQCPQLISKGLIFHPFLGTKGSSDYSVFPKLLDSAW